MDFSKAILKEQVYSSFFSFYGLGLWNKSRNVCNISLILKQLKDSLHI